jgi:Cytochrome b
MDKILVWDLPTRLFHWLLAAAFAAGWLTAGSARWLDLHVFAGYLMLGLVGFRLAWGFAGNRYARFSSFRFTPGQALAYVGDTLSGGAKRYLGHNPAGSWAIYGLLALGLSIGISGLLTLGGQENHGPFAGLFSRDLGHGFKQFHEALASAMLALVAFHLAGVAVESVLHKENLAKAMVTGRKAGKLHQGSLPRRRAGVLVLAAVMGFGAWYFKDYFTQTPDKPYLPFAGPALPDNPTWRAECGSCHLAYHPVLLPARSWRRMMAEQDRHFGEDLALDPATAKEILAFLQTHAAETHLTKTAYGMDRSVPTGEAPLRITETRYWQRAHRDIPEEAWRHPKVSSKANCAACHRDAEQGSFSPGAMGLPSTP